MSTEPSTSARATVDDPSTEAIVNALILSMTSGFTVTDGVGLDDLRKWVERIAYQGLNVPEMRKLIASRLNQKFGKNAASELEKCVAIGLFRGNNIGRIMSTIEDGVKEEVKGLISCLQIKESLKSSRKAITFSRINVCFPEVTIKAAAYLEYKGPVMGLPDGYPSAMRCACFGSMIPTSEVAGMSKATIKSIKMAYTFYTCKFSLAIAPTRRGQIKKTEVTPALFAEQLNFVNIAMSSSSVSDSRRAEWLKLPIMKVFEGDSLVRDVLDMAELGREMTKDD